MTLLTAKNPRSFFIFAADDLSILLFSTAAGALEDAISGPLTDSVTFCLVWFNATKVFSDPGSVMSGIHHASQNFVFCQCNGPAISFKGSRGGISSPYLPTNYLL